MSIQTGYGVWPMLLGGAQHQVLTQSPQLLRAGQPLNPALGSSSTCPCLRLFC